MEKLNKLIGQRVTVAEAGYKNVSGVLSRPRGILYFVIAEGVYRSFHPSQVERVVGSMIVLK